MHPSVIQDGDTSRLHLWLQLRGRGIAHLLRALGLSLRCLGRLQFDAKPSKVSSLVSRLLAGCLLCSGCLGLSKRWRRCTRCDDLHHSTSVSAHLEWRVAVARLTL